MGCGAQFAVASPTSARKVLWLFIDESGDFNFTNAGSPYYIFTGLWTYQPLCLEREVTAARYSLLASGSKIQRFHASENGLQIRSTLFGLLGGHHCHKVASIVLRKCRVNPAIRSPRDFYPQFLDYLVKFILKGDARYGYQDVIIVTDTPPTNRIGKAVRNALATTVPKYIAPGAGFRVLQHPATAHGCLQAVDYCSWAINRKWCGKSAAEYKTVNLRMDKGELDVFWRGDTDYY